MLYGRILLGTNVPLVLGNTIGGEWFGHYVAFYYNTMFGPVGATLGYSNHTKKAYFFINLGYEF